MQFLKKVCPKCGTIFPLFSLPSKWQAQKSFMSTSFAGYNTKCSNCGQIFSYKNTKNAIWAWPLTFLLLVLELCALIYLMSFLSSLRLPAAYSLPFPVIFLIVFVCTLGFGGLAGAIFGLTLRFGLLRSCRLVPVEEISPRQLSSRVRISMILGTVGFLALFLWLWIKSHNWIESFISFVTCVLISLAISYAYYAYAKKKNKP